jgi:ketosteroid isomerase-like protein
VSEVGIEDVRSAYAAWNSSDLDALLERTHPDFHFDVAGVFPGFEGTYHGREGMREIWNLWHEAFDPFKIEVERLIDLGDQRFLGLLWFVGTGRESGIETRIKYAQLARFEEGLVREMVGYADWDEALRAAGLDPAEVD